MTWEIAIALMGAVGGLCGGGTLIYMVVNKSLLSRGEKASAQSTEKENQQKDIETGLNAINFYNQIDSLIKSHTDPLNAKIDKLTDRWDKFGCYRECEMRVRNEHDAKKVTLADIKKR